jgi:hypothetical protein
MARFVDLPGAVFPLELGRAFEAATEGLVVTGATVTVTRQNETFVFGLLSRGPRTAEEGRGRIGMVEARGVDADQIARAVTWARGALRNVEVRPHLTSWPVGLSLDARVADVARLFPGAKPALVEVACGTPTTERGEEPMGQVSIRLRLAYDDGTPVFVDLDGAYTDASDHVAIGRDYADRGAALARTLGVSCETLA